VCCLLGNELEGRTLRWQRRLAWAGQLRGADLGWPWPWGSCVVIRRACAGWWRRLGLGGGAVAAVAGRLHGDGPRLSLAAAWLSGGPVPLACSSNYCWCYTGYLWRVYKIRMDGYVSKPFDEEQLYQAVSRLVVETTDSAVWWSGQGAATTCQ
jgi:hypothetical protein